MSKSSFPAISSKSSPTSPVLALSGSLLSTGRRRAEAAMAAQAGRGTEGEGWTCPRLSLGSTGHRPILWGDPPDGIARWSETPSSHHFDPDCGRGERSEHPSCTRCGGYSRRSHPGPESGSIGATQSCPTALHPSSARSPFSSRHHRPCQVFVVCPIFSCASPAALFNLRALTRFKLGSEKFYL